jgi:spermidine synthase
VDEDRWCQIGSARAPGGVELCLYQRGGEFMVRADGLELMSTRASYSEAMLAEEALRGLAGRSNPRVLIGGLGLGFTLRAARALLDPSARIVVAELVPAIVDWHRGPLAILGALDDPRVEVAVGDVLLAARQDRWDAILLDLDNGPAPLTDPGNEVHYTRAGIEALGSSLAPRGALAVWSAYRDRGFEGRIAEAGFGLEVFAAPARGRAGDPEHTVYVARR